MSWAIHAIAELEAGRSVVIKPRGNSMSPIVKDGQAVRVEPVDAASLSKGDVVLVTVKGNDYLHKVTATDKHRVQIGNNRGRINGWVPRERVYGRAALKK